MITIPKNTLPQELAEKDSRCDEKVVQRIVDAFLHGGAWKTFHPFSDGPYRRVNNFVAKDYFWDDSDDGKCVKFTNTELDRAVELLKDAGYFFYRKYEYGTWLAYFCSPRPSCENAVRVDIVEHFNP